MTPETPDSLGRLLDEVPVREAPVPVLVAAGRAARHRRRYAAAGAAAVAVVAAVAATALVGGARGDGGAEIARDPAASSPTASPTASPAGASGGLASGETAVDLPTSSWRPGDVADLARGGGVLSVDPQGCVYLAAEDGSPTYAVWPAGYTATLDADGVLTMRGPDGEVVAAGGDALRAGGGYADATTPGEHCLPATGQVFSIQSALTVTGSPADVRDLPDRVEVTCAAGGIRVGDTAVAARRTGVVLVVTSSLPTGSYLAYDSEGRSGGDALAAGSRTWTYAFPPGPLTLSCSDPDGDPVGTPADLLVDDPGGYWRGVSLESLGCGEAGSGAGPSWIRGLGATADTERAAVDGVLANLTRLTPGVYAAAPGETGYVDAATQTWVATKDGVPHLTIEVRRAGAAYTAGPAALCDAG